MEVLKIELKQHTPLLHFQHESVGATLRASEVKPKLDKFLVDKMLSDGCTLRDVKQKYAGWFIRDTDSLNYKLNIEADDRNMNIILGDDGEKKKEDKETHEIKTYYFLKNFPMLLSNMGGKEKKSELVNLVKHNFIELTFLVANAELKEHIKKWIERFFAVTNFGQRSSKGFGSFTVSKIDGDKKEWNEENYYPSGTPLMVFKYLNDRMIFDVIDFYWKCLKAGINYTQNKRYKERYIKSFLYVYLNNMANPTTWEKKKIKETFHLGRNDGTVHKENPNPATFARGILGCPDKYSYGSREVKVENTETEESLKIDRIPTPIYFKPVCFSSDKTVFVYVLFDSAVVERLSTVGNKTFKFTLNNSSMTLDLNMFLNKDNYMEFIDAYNDYLCNDPDVVEALCDGVDKTSLIDYEGVELEDDSWGFVPRNHNWVNILKGINGKEDKECVMLFNV